MRRESWKSRVGFVLAASGSAVGLVNIWRFPYVVAKYGGGAFILVYLFFLLAIGFPVLVSETLIGRTAKLGPAGALPKLSRKPRMRYVGMGMVATGFLVSSFYSVVAAWVVGYFVQSLRGFGAWTSVAVAQEIFNAKVGSTPWILSFHLVFMGLSALILVRGVRKGLELGNKFFMPVLALLLVGLMVRGLTLPGAAEGVGFIFRVDFSQLTAFGILTALGHAFFTLSLGQGTMITYGSYLSGKEQLPNTCAPVVIFDTFISLFAGIAILTVLFAGNEGAAGGVGLIFSVLPVVFNGLPGGAIMASLFFFLILLAALTSQVSAMEPLINHFVDSKQWSRARSVGVVAGGAFLVGIPSALAFGLLSGITLFHANIFDMVSGLCAQVLIPIGGLVAVLFVGWIWGFGRAFPHLFGNYAEAKRSHRILQTYLQITIKYLAPLFILIILIASLWGA